MQSFKGQAAASVHRLNQITRISYTIFICESKTNLNKCYKIDMATDDVTMNALLESVAKYFNVAEFTKLLLSFIFLFWAQLSLNHFTIIVPGVGELGDIAVVARLHQARRPKDKRQRTQRTTALRVL